MAVVHPSIALLSMIVFSLSPPASGVPNRLVAFLIDGLRWDYPFSDPELSEFQAMAREGARARYVTPDFPVKSYPNYYTIMTGLHTESHGMTGNYMHDVMRNTSFLLGYNPESYEPYWWEGAEPIWITATKQERKVNMYYWPTCEVPIFNTLPNKCEPYAGYPTYNNITDSIDEIVQLFSERAVDMAFVYFEDVDRLGHAHGVESQQRLEATRDVSRFLEYLRENLGRTGQSDDVNVVVMSDHGMATVEYGPSGGYVSLSSFIDHNDLDNPVFYETSYVSMWPKEERLDKVYADLQRVPHSVAYKKEDIPEGWHYKNGKYVPPLLLVMTFPYLIGKDSVVTSRRTGSHAWDNALMDMKGVFMAVGPDFRAGFVGDSIHQVDIYQMMCEITGVSPRPHNGSVLRIQGLLNDPTGVSGGVRTTSQITWATAAVFAVSFLLRNSY
ncbi:ENPP6 [Branchiostoma lanceolatum]|uniref:glycerophosphocholine cholinephosphodiesterase n=1 Tax=Branchiostoma lanceolatum TaxID=7740 RepID=A0A8K0ESV9_BRALA|nr:ENPP6 [Branchiostoma lanceolatum]